MKHFNIAALSLALGLLSLAMGTSMANPVETSWAQASNHATDLRTRMQGHVASMASKFASEKGHRAIQYWRENVGLIPRRHLAENNTCTPEVLYEGDNTTLVTFAGFDSICTCDEEEPDIAAFLATYDGPPQISLVNEFLVDFNNFLNGSSFSQDNTCFTRCALCFEGYCATKQTAQSTEVTLVLSRLVTYVDFIQFDENSTQEELDLFFGDILLLDDFVYTDKDCYAVISGPETGLVCISFIISFTPDGPISLSDLTEDFDPSTQALPTCVASVDGTDCNSCTLTISASGQGCVQADCTNVIPNAMPDSCAVDAASTFVGILEPMYIFDVQDDAFAQQVENGNVNADCSPILTIPPSDVPSSALSRFVPCPSVAVVALSVFAYAWM